MILWKVGLVSPASDSLIVRHADTTASVAVRDITELRLVRSSGEAARRDAPVDQIYQLPVWDVAQKRRVIQQIFRERGAPQTAPPGRSP